MPHYDYLIVGGGMTADAAARGIREVDPKRTIGIISAELHAPYNRPPLSKGLWKGDKPETVWRHFDETGARLHTGRRAMKLDVGMRRVTDDQRETYGYKRLLLATGGEPRRLPDAPEGVIYFRTLDDYRRTKLYLEHNARFVVLGGGFIGSEVAAALRMNGADVTMVVPEQGIGARVLPADLAKYVTAYYRNKGIVVHAADSVEKIDPNAGRFTVRARSAGNLDADCVIAGLGIVPSVELAKEAMIAVDNGIVVDEKLHTNQPDVFAAGDVANFANPVLGKRMRVEHEDNANTMGKVAGRNMAGADEPYDHLPFFYSDLFDLGYEAVGELDPRLETVADWKTEFREGVIYYLDKGRVRGVLLWGIFGQVDAARTLIAEPGPFSPQSLRGRLSAS